MEHLGLVFTFFQLISQAYRDSSDDEDDLAFTATQGMPNASLYSSAPSLTLPTSWSSPTDMSFLGEVFEMVRQ